MWKLCPFDFSLSLFGLALMMMLSSAWTGKLIKFQDRKRGLPDLFRGQYYNVMVFPSPRCGVMFYSSCPLFTWQMLSPARMTPSPSPLRSEGTGRTTRDESEIYTIPSNPSVTDQYTARGTPVWQRPVPRFTPPHLATLGSSASCFALSLSVEMAPILPSVMHRLAPTSPALPLFAKMACL